MQADDGVLEAIAIDDSNDWIYWSGNVGVRRKMLDGSNEVESLLPSNIDGIALDAERDVLYYVPSSRQLHRMNLMDYSTERLGHKDIYSLVVDPVGRKIYWTENRNTNSTPLLDDRISWSNLDEVFRPQVLYEVPGPVNNQVPASLAIDQVTRKLYVAIAGPNESVVRSNLAEDPRGLDYEIFVDETGGYSLGLAIDANARELYWSNLAGEILRTDLDGPGSTNGDGANMEVVATGLERPEALAIAGGDESPPDRCSVVLSLVPGDGVLSVECQPVVFPSTSITGQDVLAVANDDTWTATDTTLSHAGWHVTLIADDHLRGNLDPINHVIEIGANRDFLVHCLDSEIVTVSGDSVNLPTCTNGPQAIPVADDNPITVIYANQGSGMGVYDFLPHFEILVPGTTIIDTYSTDIWVYITASP